MTFYREIANVIWLKLKGLKVPESYDDAECKRIVDRYWHKAMESEQ
jgi:hypothetical protein